MVIFYFVLGAFLRRWYGGLFDDKQQPILGNRGLQSVCMVLAFMNIYLTNPESWQNWINSLIISLWLQFQFWSRGHGCCFDIGRGTEPDISRYNERWYHYPIDFLFDKILRQPQAKYGFLYDFLYMFMRYICPILVMIVFDIRYIIIGLLVAPIYAFNWTLYERETWLRPSKEWLNSPTKWSEIIVGGLVYSGCYLLKWGLS